MRSRMTTKAPLILASASIGRKHILTQLQLPFTVETPDFDEDSLKEALEGKTPRQKAMALAEAKAVQASEKLKGKIVIGGDQVCAFQGRTLSKPGTRQRAQSQLRMLAGHIHHLHTAGAIAQNGKLLWSGVETISLHMRPLKDADINTYLDQEDVLMCCGSYKVESLGRFLFSRIDGDSASVPGLPIMQMVDALTRLKLVSLGA